LLTNRLSSFPLTADGSDNDCLWRLNHIIDELLIYLVASLVHIETERLFRNTLSQIQPRQSFKKPIVLFRITVTNKGS
jgi:hypothetical protein